MKGRPPKPPGRRQGHRAHRTLALRVEERVAPTAPDGLLRLTQERWGVYWSSDLSRATRDTHLPVVERLFYLYDERERSYRAVRKLGRFVEGSQGQLVQHPALKYIHDCDAEIRQLEDRLGLSPRAMAQLGANFANAQRSLDDLNRSVSDSIEETEVDPRIELVKSGESSTA